MSAYAITIPVPGQAPMFRALGWGRSAAIVLLFALSANILYAGQPKPRKHDTRHEIEQLEEEWRMAVLKSDAAVLKTLLADDYIAITANGTLQTKDEALAAIRSGRIHFTVLNLSDRKLRFYGKTALVTSLASVQGVTPEGELSGSFRYTRVYVLNPQGQWRIVSFEASRIRLPGEHREKWISRPRGTPPALEFASSE
jgi:ketosteroid isomerase-like protein